MATYELPGKQVVVELDGRALAAIALRDDLFHTFTSAADAHFALAGGAVQLTGRSAFTASIEAPDDGPPLVTFLATYAQGAFVNAGHHTLPWSFAQVAIAVRVVEGAAADPRQIFLELAWVDLQAQAEVPSPLLLKELRAALLDYVRNESFAAPAGSGAAGGRRLFVSERLDSLVRLTPVQWQTLGLRATSRPAGDADHSPSLALVMPMAMFRTVAVPEATASVVDVGGPALSAGSSSLRTSDRVALRISDLLLLETAVVSTLFTALNGDYGTSDFIVAGGHMTLQPGRTPQVHLGAGASELLSFFMNRFDAVASPQLGSVVALIDADVRFVRQLDGLTPFLGWALAADATLAVTINAALDAGDSLFFSAEVDVSHVSVSVTFWGYLALAAIAAVFIALNVISAGGASAATVAAVAGASGLAFAAIAALADGLRQIFMAGSPFAIPSFNQRGPAQGTPLPQHVRTLVGQVAPVRLLAPAPP